MNEQQKKGLFLIIGGILSYFIIPRILELLGLYFLGRFPIIYIIIALVLTVLGIINLASSNKNNEDEGTMTSGQINQGQQVTSQAQLNKVVNVTLTGGIIGLLGVSPQNELNNRIKKENANGWRVVQIIPAASGNIFLYLLRIILLTITAFLYTTTNGYYVVMEKNIPDNI